MTTLFRSVLQSTRGCCCSCCCCSSCCCCFRYCCKVMLLSIMLHHCSRCRAHVVCILIVLPCLQCHSQYQSHPVLDREEANQKHTGRPWCPWQSLVLSFAGKMFSLMPRKLCAPSRDAHVVSGVIEGYTSIGSAVRSGEESRHREILLHMLARCISDCRSQQRSVSTGTQVTPSILRVVQRFQHKCYIHSQ